MADVGVQLLRSDETKQCASVGSSYAERVYGAGFERRIVQNTDLTCLPVVRHVRFLRARQRRIRFVEDERNEHQRIKVVDRRRFTGAGELREPHVQSSERAAEPAREMSGDVGQGEPEFDAASGSHAASGASWSSTVRFEQLVNLLAQNALMLLQGTSDVQRSPEQARFFIDLLAVLEAKTRGNLSVDEQEMISTTLYQLRSLYVQGRS